AVVAGHIRQFFLHSLLLKQQAFLALLKHHFVQGLVEIGVGQTIEPVFDLVELQIEVLGLLLLPARRRCLERRDARLVIFPLQVVITDFLEELRNFRLDRFLSHAGLWTIFGMAPVIHMAFLSFCYEGIFASGARKHPAVWIIVLVAAGVRFAGEDGLNTVKERLADDWLVNPDKGFIGLLNANEADIKGIVEHHGKAGNLHMAAAFAAQAKPIPFLDQSFKVVLGGSI